MSTLARKAFNRGNLNEFARLVTSYARGNTEGLAETMTSGLSDVEYGDIYRFKDDSCLVRDYFGKWEVHTRGYDLVRGGLK